MTSVSTMVIGRMAEFASAAAVWRAEAVLRLKTVVSNGGCQLFKLGRTTRN